jgi:anti-sigma factor RsiW
MTQDTTLRANTLTQLSSREQLSALMDGALPPDETRFLLRRLQHDASLAECWQRWRLGGEVMRGLAPAQRLPADFATRVSAAIFDSGQGTVLGEPVERRAPKPAWLRWGGGAAMAASLAVVVGFIARQPAVETPATPAAAAGRRGCGRGRSRSRAGTRVARARSPLAADRQRHLGRGHRDGHRRRIAPAAQPRHHA